MCTSTTDRQSPARPDYFTDIVGVYEELEGELEAVSEQLQVLCEFHDDMQALDSIGAASMSAQYTDGTLELTATVHVTHIKGKPREILDKYDWTQNSIEYIQEARGFDINLELTPAATQSTDASHESAP